jgi:hypothetical protein
MWVTLCRAPCPATRNSDPRRERPICSGCSRHSSFSVYDRNGIATIRANGFGVSLITEERLKKQRPGSYVWKLQANFPMPHGLGLNPDTRFHTPGQKPDHYFLCPQSDMTLGEYTARLSKLALTLERVRKL